MYYESLKVITKQKHNIYLNDHEKRIKAYHYQKTNKQTKNKPTSIQKERQQERKKETKELRNNKREINKMSIITLNVSGLNSPVK